MRLAVTAFARHIFLPAKFIAHDRRADFSCRYFCFRVFFRPTSSLLLQFRIQWFLNVHIGSRQEPSFADLVRKYTAAVRRVQRAFRRILRMRQAYLEALMAHFSADHLVKAELSRLWSAHASVPSTPAVRELEEVPKPKAANKSKRDSNKRDKGPKGLPSKGLPVAPPPPSGGLAPKSFRSRRRNAIQITDPLKLIPDAAPAWVKDRTSD